MAGGDTELTGAPHGCFEPPIHLVPGVLNEGRLLLMAAPSGSQSAAKPVDECVIGTSFPVVEAGPDGPLRVTPPAIDEGTHVVRLVARAIGGPPRVTTPLGPRGARGCPCGFGDGGSPESAP